MKNNLPNIITRNLGGFFFLAYAYTILMPWGTKDYFSKDFYVILLQSFMTLVVFNILMWSFSKARSNRNNL